jgi:hypothetical protein
MRPPILSLILLLLTACASVPDEVIAEEAPLHLVDGLVRQDIAIPTLRGVLHAEAVYAPRTLLRANRRVVLMIPGTLANGAGYYAVNEPGYDASRILAEAGFIVGLIDLPGTGESYRPADGRTVDSARAAWAVERVAIAFSWRFLVSSFDVYGETGVGTSVGLLLAREPWVRSVALSAVFYREFGPGAGPLFDPGYQAFIESDPAGYSPLDPAFVGAFFGAADPDVRAAAVTACLGPPPGTVNIGAFHELFAIPFTVAPGPVFILDEPIVDARPARRPALLVQGSPDFIGSEPGTEELRAEYGLTGGGVATVATLPGASHLMRFDVAISDGASSPFWTAVLDFYAAH